MRLLYSRRTGGSVIRPHPLAGGMRSSRNWTRHIFNKKIELSKRKARKNSDGLRLTNS
jgi:hypothetical protein